MQQHWKLRIGGLAIFMLAAGLRAQTPPAEPLTFEVATLRIAAPASENFLSGGPGTDNPGQIIGKNFPLFSLLLRAYGVKTYQIVGPPWMQRRNYDLVAKIPIGATRAQVWVMLQNLLIEELHLKIHHETRQFPGYELVIAKGGLKMKESEPGGRVSMTQARLPNGLTRVTARQIPIAILVGRAEGEMDGRHVVDSTGLSAKYDFELDFIPEGLAAGTPDLPGSDFVTALREQLGLRLEPKNVPVDVLVVEEK